jgi:hypothetical protein
MVQGAKRTLKQGVTISQVSGKQEDNIDGPRAQSYIET